MTHFCLTVLVACFGVTLLLCAVAPVEFDALTFEAYKEDGIVLMPCVFSAFPKMFLLNVENGWCNKIYVSKVASSRKCELNSLSCLHILIS